jgi:hypothetical protein
VESLKVEDRRFNPGDLVWFWNGGTCSGLVIESGLGLSTGSSAFSYLVARGDLGPGWIHGSQLWDRPEDVQPLLASHAMRVYPSLIAQEIVQVQPMPTGALLFYFDEMEKRMEEALENVGKEGKEGED